MAFYQLQSQSATIGTTALLLADINGSRIHFSIQNRSPNNIYVYFGDDGSINANVNNSILVLTGETYNPISPGRGRIYGLSNTEGNSCVIVEG